MFCTVLLVDDDDLVRELFTHRLEQVGYRVLTAADGRDGLQTAARERPDAILLDLSMPVMDGWEAIGRLRAHPDTQHIPVAAFTAEALGATGDDHLRALGFDAYLPKHAPLVEFLDAVKRLLRGRG